MRRPKTSHLNAQQLRAFAECYETFATFAFTVLCARAEVLVVGKVCKGSLLVVFFVYFFFLFFFGFEMNVSIHFTLHCVSSGASHAKRTAGLGSHSGPEEFEG